MKNVFKCIFSKNPYLSVLGEILKWPRITRKKANEILQEVHKVFYGSISKAKRDSIVLLTKGINRRYFAISSKSVWTTLYPENPEFYPTSVEFYSNKINLVNLMTGETLQKERDRYAS